MAISRILKDDFESVVHRHQAMLYRIAFNFFRNAHIAEEVVQDVFLKLYENLDTIDSPERVESWLRRTATHRCIDVWRMGMLLNETQLNEIQDVAAEAPESDLLLNEILRGLVGSLPEKHRMIVILRYAEDMNSDEIGAAMDMPAATVRSYLQRALALLREKAPRALGEEIDGSIRKQSS
jgi:RNA polymerase sigma-70 factor (ECF subfamily)